MSTNDPSQRVFVPVKHVEASSVLNGDLGLYGPHHMLEESETCWNSDGAPNHSLCFDFWGPRATVTAVEFVFQEGFVGQNMTIESDGCEKTSLPEAAYFQPKDTNEPQLFSFSLSLTSRESVRVSFKGSTDFYGRIVVYSAKWFS